MPKMKSHSGAAKRFKKTRTGKILRGQANIAHYLEGKSSTRKRRLQRSAEVSRTDRPRVRKLLGG
jgi:large subunit ribosomal protein L35